jgi:hypothetical protein
VTDPVAAAVADHATSVSPRSERPSPRLLPPTPAAAAAEAASRRERTATARRTIVAVVAAAAVAIVAVTGWITTNRGPAPVATRVVADPIPPPVDIPPPVNSVPAPHAEEARPAGPAAGAENGRTAAVPGPAEKSPPSAGGTDSTAKPPPAAPAATPPAEQPGTSASAAGTASAKQLFAEGSSRNAGLRYVIIQKNADGVEAEVDPDTTFHSGDLVRFAFEPSIDGYLYVVQEGSSGTWSVLFPHPMINGGTNAVRRSEKYTVPSNGWFRFNNAAGTERAFVFLSKDPLDTLPGFKEPVERMESVRQSVVDDLKRSINPRDLVFERDPPANPGAPGPKRQSTFVVNRDELGKFVSATIQLVHQ